MGLTVDSVTSSREFFPEDKKVSLEDSRITEAVKKSLEPKVDFPAVLNDSRLWAQLGDLEKSLMEDPLGAGNPNFVIGAATCTYQDSGVEFPHSQWTAWQKKCIKDPANRSSPNANLLALYKTPEGRNAISDRLHKLGFTSFRLSVEWSDLQPHPGIWHLEKLQVYVDLIKHLRDEGIEVMITLHHFSEPDWFHKLGSFEKEENILYFVEFCKKVFPVLTQSYKGAPLVKQFCTINEPAIEAFSRYILKDFSPGCFMNFARAGNFLKGALKAHCAVYDILKKNAPPEVQIGMVHQYLKFVPKFSFLDLFFKHWTHLTNDVSLAYFKTGKFEFKVPFVHIVEEGPKPKTDFIGVQFYARPVVGYPMSYHEPMTQMPFREDPEGLYEAIIETYKAVGKPVIVTENGISTHDPVQRERYMLRAMYAAREAGKVIGSENLAGYFVWSLGDNLEWNRGMKPQAFGVYALTKDGLALDPKPGTEIIGKVAAASKRVLAAAA